MELIRATTKDVKKLLEIEKTTIGLKLYSGYFTEEEVEGYVKDSIVYLIGNDDDIVGSISYDVIDSDHADISGLVIKPEFQKQGMAKRAMELLFEKLKDYKKLSLCVHPDNHARKLYESFGFVVESRKENYFDDGEPRLIMVKNKMMKRILILGSVGSGKSTLAHKLHEKLGLPVICLDQYFWKPKWQITEDEEWRKKVTELVQGDGWIMEGNYQNTLDIRLPVADTIILMDRSRFLCLYRLIKRIIGKREHGNIEGCEERLNFKLLIWILWKFPQQSKKRILHDLETVKNAKNIFILKSNKEVEDFLLNLA